MAPVPTLSTEETAALISLFKACDRTVTTCSAHVKDEEALVALQATEIGTLRSRIEAGASTPWWVWMGLGVVTTAAGFVAVRH